jgi:hypothetical protein
MKFPLTRISKICWQYCAARLLDAWQTPAPLRPHPAPSGLELPLTPLPQAHRFAQCHLLCMVLYAGQLAWSAHWVAAPAMLMLAALQLFALRHMWPQDAGAPRRLLVAADGRVHVATVGGSVEPVEVGGESLWLGSVVLLVLHAASRKHRVLLGSGNLDAAGLATLRRRLRGAATACVDPAVDSCAVSGQGASVVEQFIRGRWIRRP